MESQNHNSNEAKPVVKRYHKYEEYYRYLFILAILPCGIYGICHFGIRALFHILLTVATCTASEFLFEHYTHKPISAGDGNAIITGLLLAYLIPVSAPLWSGVLGGLFASIIFRKLLAGINFNFLNPVFAAKALLLILFPTEMSDYSYGYSSSITPLETLKISGKTERIDIWKMIKGDVAGTIGETCIIAILAGALLLILFDVISIKIPAIIILTVAALLTGFNMIFNDASFNVSFISAHLAGGGLMLAAWFTANDGESVPSLTKVQVLYALIIGILISVFRYFTDMKDTVTFAVLAANLVSFLFSILRKEKSRRKQLS